MDESLLTGGLSYLLFRLVTTLPYGHQTVEPLQVEVAQAGMFRRSVSFCMLSLQICAQGDLLKRCCFNCSTLRDNGQGKGIPPRGSFTPSLHAPHDISLCISTTAFVVYILIDTRNMDPIAERLLQKQQTAIRRDTMVDPKVKSKKTL